MANTAQVDKIKLNLLYNQGVPQKLTVRLLKWLITYGKVIVIVVDILVISAFAYRFKLDYDLSNLNRRINNQLDFIESLRQEEVKLSQFQNRLSLIETHYQNYPPYDNFFTKVTAIIPQSITLSSLDFKQKENSDMTLFTINGETNNSNDLSRFLNSLKKDFTNIELQGLYYDEGKFVFTITGETK